MESYTGFAEVYDMFMDNIPYDAWCGYVTALLRERGVEDGLVLDLGCGTGMLTRRLAARGYDMIGVDASADMLQAAMEKQAQLPDAGDGKPQESRILYLQQDMRRFELYGTVRAVVSICDCMNYLLEYEELVQVLRLVNNYLDPGGVFIFDMNTPYKYREILGEQTIAENRDEGSFIWENCFDEETQINEYDLTLFVREEDGRYRKHEETHYQRSYDLLTVRQAVCEAGMDFLAAYDAFTHEVPAPDSERIYIIAGERGKQRCQII